MREEEQAYWESPEESDDFDEPDPDGSDLLFSQYEVQELQEETPIDLQVDTENEADVQAESNETDKPGAPSQTAHDKSAPLEDSPEQE